MGMNKDAVQNERQPRNTATLRPENLASLDSIRECANTLLQQEDKIDILINNAGNGLSKKRQIILSFNFCLVIPTDCAHISIYLYEI